MENIVELKAKHGNKLSYIKVKDSWDNTYEFVIKPPTRTVKEALADITQEAKAKKQPFVTQVSKVLLANCVIDGDIEALEDGEVYDIVLEKINELNGKATVELKKL